MLFLLSCVYRYAPDALKELIRKFCASDVKEMQEYGRTLRNWSEEIINAFIIVRNSYMFDKDTG